MAITTVSGILGDLSVGGAALDEVRNWSVDITIDSAMHPDSDSGGWKTSTEGALAWTGRFTANCDSGKLTSALWTAFIARTQLAFSGTATTGVTWTGSLKLTGVTGYTVDIESADPLSQTWTFNGDGAFTPATA